jgi:hypothetical protein
MRSSADRTVICAIVCAGAGLLNAASFTSDVRPILSQTCHACHNEKLASGGLDVAPLFDASSLTKDRQTWERILAKLRAGDMPPEGVPRPPAEKLGALVNFVQGEFDRADRRTPPDPGRVVAHRLNRSEYANTIRDLFGVDFPANEEFPADDSSDGFDNIGGALAVSPALMQKYLSAAERIASRAVGGDPLPKPAILNHSSHAKRLGPGAIELVESLDYDADYVVRTDVVGHRGDHDKPVTVTISVDGSPAATASVPVQISAVNKQGGATQRTTVEAKVFLTANRHLVRTEFIDDADLQNIPRDQWFNNNRNIYPENIEIIGPFAPAELHPMSKRFLTCDPAAGAACVDRILSTFARRAFRRPVTRAEVGELTRVFDQAKSSGYSPAQSLQFAITAALVSPNFLFRIERDPKPGIIARIGDVELASRLSYFLWSSMPDDELLALGESGKLHTPAVLDAQVRRMLADPKSEAFAENFAGQWLETRSLDAIRPDPKKFPEWSPDLKEAMRTETRLFFEAVMREDRPISDFIDGKYTFVNELLAKHYGIPGVTGPEFRRVDLTPETSLSAQRSGVLTQASVLTVSSYPSRTSVVLRGKYLLENILGSPPPPPPPDVPRLNEEAVGVAQSLRQQMEAHRSDPVCASCHSKMDALGFALENYDAIGRWRTQDGKFPIDASGSFPDGRTFNGPAQMKEILKQNMPEFTRCLAEKMLTYSLGRGLDSDRDRATVNAVAGEAALSSYRFQSMIMAIVHSAPFQQRRGEPKQ